MLKDHIEKVANARAVLGRYRRHFIAELVKLARLVLDRFRLDLVGGNYDRLACVAQQNAELLVERCHARTRIEHPNYRLRFVDGVRRLLKDIRRNYRLVVRNDAAGVDETKRL